MKNGISITNLRRYGTHGWAWTITRRDESGTTICRERTNGSGAGLWRESLMMGDLEPTYHQVLGTLDFGLSDGRSAAYAKLRRSNADTPAWSV